jgi:Holliday junction resolvase RusA-like endonuclease
LRARAGYRGLVPDSAELVEEEARDALAVFHIGRPDGDNILKAIGDGLNGVVWRDDSLIAQCSITKRYGDTPGAAITVRRL